MVDYVHTAWLKRFKSLNVQWFGFAHHRESSYLVSHIQAPYPDHHQSSSEFGKTSEG
jgi:hypothetical protein